MFQSGVLDRTRLFSNFLLIVLLAGNLYFSVQFIEQIRKPVAEEQTNSILRIKSSRLLKSFIDKVLNAQGDIPFEDRVELENSVLKVHDQALTNSWKTFVESKNSKDAQTNAVKFMVLLVNKIQ
jgi:hypothetical protein